MITFEDLLAVIENSSDFLLNVQKNYMLLLKWKLQLYQSRLTANNELLLRDFNKLKSLKVTEQLKEYEVQLRYPELYLSFKLYERYMGIIELIQKKLKSISTDNIRESLLLILRKHIQPLLTVSITTQIAQYLIDKVFSLQRGYKQFTNVFSNILILGGAGAGKTLVARTIASVLSKLGNKDKIRTYLTYV